MTDPARTKPAEALDELACFFEAYCALTEQLGQASAGGDIELLAALIDLRQSTRERIDAFEAACAGLLSEARRDVSEELLVRKAAIARLITRIRDLETGLPDRLAHLRDAHREQAAQLACGQRRLRGYAPVLERRSAYVEETK